MTDQSSPLLARIAAEAERLGLLKPGAATPGDWPAEAKPRVPEPEDDEPERWWNK